MEIILHCGAHRCATTSFQRYLRNNAPELSRDGLTHWGPERTGSNGLNNLNNLTPAICDGLRRELDACERAGATQLLVSQENFVGSMVRNIKFASLYPSAQQRGQWLAKVFEGRVTRIALNIRALDMYWTSVASYMFKRGKAQIQPATWKRIAQSKRSWRDVITDIGLSFPGVPLLVLPFEEFAGYQQEQLEALTGRTAPNSSDGLMLNSAPKPAPHDLNARQAAKLWIDYADDLEWLASGADGVAKLINRTKTSDRGVACADIRIEQRKSQ